MSLCELRQMIIKSFNMRISMVRETDERITVEYIIVTCHLAVLSPLNRKKKKRNKILIPNKGITLERKENKYWDPFHGFLCGASWPMFVKTGTIRFQGTSYQSKCGFHPHIPMCKGTKLGSETLREDSAGIWR